MSNDRDNATPPTGLPLWVHSTVVLTLAGLLVWNVVRLGPEGYPNSMLIGGLLGAYAGLNELLKRNKTE